VLDDVIRGIILCDALEHIDFVMSLFLPKNVEGEIADRYQMKAMLEHTTKPIIAVSYEVSGCVDAVEMAEAALGGPDSLRKKPIIASYINVTSGLRHDKDALGKLLYLAEKGLPVIYVPGTCGGITGPVTVAGSVAARNAGALVGLTIAQLKREGTPVILPGQGGSALDMQTLVDPYVRPDSQGVHETLAHWYGLPMFTTAGASDAKLGDQQAGIEAALTLLVDSLAGGNIIHDLGYLESGLCGSLVQLTICNEIVAWIKALMSEVEISEETLAVSVVDDVGPDGEFMSCDHTLQHFRDRWYPRLFERNDYEGWLAKGGEGLAERAGALVGQILSEHTPEPLSDRASQAIDAIVQQAKQAG
jgi:trimethylamine--corrinoid protein Co-methyltransferase